MVPMTVGVRIQTAMMMMMQMTTTTITTNIASITVVQD